MHLYLVLALIFIIFSWVLECGATLLNLKALSPELPEEFSDSVDAPRYARSQEYTRVNSKVELLSGAAGTLIIVLCLTTGVFTAVDHAAMAVSDNTIIQGLVFFGLIGAGSGVLSLPVSIYRTFVVEERFGFNRTSWRTFVTDRIKGAILTGVIGGTLLAGILWFFSSFGMFAWLYAWAFMVVITMLIQYIAPVWIMPLFNKFTPLPEGELRTAIEQYIRKTGFSLSGLYLIDGSRRSGKANAFFTGFGKKKRIALFDTLTEKLTTPETVAVVAHEVGHSSLGHIRRMLTQSVIKLALVLLLLGFILDHATLYAAFGMDRASIHAGILLFSFLYTPVSLFFGIRANKKSREYEFEADAFAAQTTGTPEALSNALKALAKENLSNLTPHPFMVWLHYTHPPVLQRIHALKTK